MAPQLDIVIPVYNEGQNILATLSALAREVKTPARVLICYDREDDDTLPAVRGNPDAHAGLAGRVRAQPRPRRAWRGDGRICRQHRAARRGVIPPTTISIAGILDRMVALAQQGCDIVCASRFMPGGTMQGCPWLKAVLVRTAAFTLHHFARLPTQDASSGFRLFSRRVEREIAVESDQGFCYSIELAGEGAPAGLAHRRSAGALVRAQARHQPFSGC